MFKLSQHCVSRRKSFRELRPYRERTSTQCSAICAVARIASPSTSMKRAPSSAFVWPVFSVISLGVTQSIKERKILDEVRTLLQTNQKDLVPLSHRITERFSASLLVLLSKDFPWQCESSRIAQSNPESSVFSLICSSFSRNNPLLRGRKRNL